MRIDHRILASTVSHAKLAEPALPRIRPSPVRRICLAVVDRVLAVAIRQASDIKPAGWRTRRRLSPVALLPIGRTRCERPSAAQKDYLDAEDFQNKTLITYPVEDDVRST
ncbi:hypothetical protein [Paraburkholderia sp. J8-2]|uniref:hypothetical protein n=1 Tax=Paraburkholderia sp. J8-2 TaxID=2805440 RepID=UPI002AB7A7E1|nr:hypothetical protein [Paraburkholderia sp. J8-2]